MTVRTVAWRLVQVLALAGMVLLVAGLVWSSSGPTGTIIYALAWDTDAVTSTAAGVEIESDLGYTITLTEAFVSSWSTSTVACEHDHRFSVWDWAAAMVESSVSVSPAAAGHGDASSAELVAPTVETVVTSAAIATDDALTVGEVSVSEPVWCEGHWALSGSSGSVRASGAEQNPTVSLLGAVEHPDETVTSLAVSTDLARGTKGDLTRSDGAPIEPETGEPILVTVVRDLGSMFDGIDFASFEAEPGTEDDLALAVLRNLEGSTRFVVSTTNFVS